MDRDGSGSLTPDAIAAFLTDLGLEPTHYDIRHIMQELDPASKGAVSREDFLRYIRNGGRRQASFYQIK